MTDVSKLKRTLDKIKQECNCSEDKTGLLPLQKIYQDDIWWDVFICPICKSQYKTCYNHWGIVDA